MVLLCWLDLVMGGSIRNERDVWQRDLEEGKETGGDWREKGVLDQ